jgi:hypothetical protein
VGARVTKHRTDMALRIIETKRNGDRRKVLTCKKAKVAVAGKGDSKNSKNIFL